MDGEKTIVETVEDINERRRQAANPARDLRYFSERVRTAQLMPAPVSADTVAFGSTVTFSRDDGRVQTYRIVGEDEADATKGLINWGSPLGRALLGAGPGDEVLWLRPAGDLQVEIVRVDPD